jgi:hypothetical protein
MCKTIVTHEYAGKMNLVRLQKPTQAGSFFSKARYFPGSFWPGACSGGNQA